MQLGMERLVVPDVGEWISSMYQTLGWLEAERRHRSRWLESQEVCVGVTEPSSALDSME